MKSKIIGRKQLLVGALVLSLGAAVFVNWYYTNPKGIHQTEPEVTSSVNLGDAQYVNSGAVEESTDYFTSAQLNRTKAHDNYKEQLESIISAEKTDDDTKAKAQEKLIKISEQIKLEADIENLITAQINNSCLVTLDSENAEVILPKGTVSDDVLIIIKDIILSKTSVSAQNITIVELK